MARGGGLTNFATGFLNAYVTAKDQQRKQELHELQVAKLRDERAMNEEFKTLDQNSKPVEGYVVQGPDGTRSVYADEDLARKAQAASGEGSVLQQTFLVNGQQFGSREEADQAAEEANAPAVKLRQRAEIALKYNRPDLADAYQKNYSSMIEANRRDMQEQFIMAQQAGDYNSILGHINQRLKRSGMEAQLTPNEQGGLTYTITRNGQVVQERPFKTQAEFWDSMGQQIMQTPDNMLETWKTREGLKLQERQVVAQEKSSDATVRTADANVRKTDAEIKEMPARLAIAQQNANAASTSAGASAMNANTARLGFMNPTPKVSSAPTADGGLGLFVTPQNFDPKTGQWNVGPATVMRPDGLKYPRTGGLGLDGLLGGAGASSNPLTADMTPEQLAAFAAFSRAAAASRGGPRATGAPAAPAANPNPSAGLRAPGAPVAPFAPNSQWYVAPEVEDNADPYRNLPYGR